MKFERSSGILLHPTSLSGSYGIGDLGPQAYKWIDFLAQAGCSLWQVLPLGPTGFGDSPYQCFSAFAGNPYLISPQILLDEGLLHPDDLVEIPNFPTNCVDYGAVINWKLNVLDQAYIRFQHSQDNNLLLEFDQFCHAQANWLEDFALFMSIKEASSGAPWSTWNPDIRDRISDTLEEAREEYTTAINRQMFRQFLFYRQWDSLHKYANGLGIKIIGDIPIFVAHDSADVWADPQLFHLDENGQPSVVAGVPPDYFSPTGQLWGNPLYRWDIHAEDGYSWWLKRLRAVLKQVDIIRLDHFRGFAGYWEVPGDAETAIDGRWVNGPGVHFFDQVLSELGDLPIIAEDLGVITPDVIEMRDRYGLPGMKILQFSFEGGPDDPFLPHNFVPNCVVYTGTHDNDTASGWYARVDSDARDFYRRYVGRDGRNVSWDLIRASWASVAIFAIAPYQDFLSLGNEARMNYPGNASGNWSWRMSNSALDESILNGIYEFNYLYNRMNPVTKQRQEDQKRKAEMVSETDWLEGEVVESLEEE